MSIDISNRLRIMEGGIIMIPGCEPTSVVTYISTPWSERDDVVTLFNGGRCKSSYITVDKALEVVNGSYIINSPDPASRWFVLPEGPPPNSVCPCHRVADWYTVLRDNADHPGPKDNSDDSHIDCEAFGFGWNCNSGDIL